MLNSGDKVVVIKCGALGDIVRTSYLMTALAKQSGAVVTWVTAESGTDLLRFNPYVRRICVLGRDPLPKRAQRVISLDDEFGAAKAAAEIDAPSIVGAYVGGDGEVRYSKDSGPWFDMGLLSVFGKEWADAKKKDNQRSHAEIFGEILALRHVEPVFFGNVMIEEEWARRRAGRNRVVGFNLFAGGRWPSKEIVFGESMKLVRQIQAHRTAVKIVLFCDASTRPRAEVMASQFDHVEIWDCSAGVLDFAAAVKACDYVISTDSLGLHFAIAQKVPNLSVYAPTSAAEIDTFGSGTKVISTSHDYCSYLPLADNTSLTAVRVFEAWEQHVGALGW